MRLFLFLHIGVNDRQNFFYVGIIKLCCFVICELPGSLMWSLVAFSYYLSVTAGILSLKTILANDCGLVIIAKMSGL